ncbi:MAG: VanW family protein [Acidimicrobiia bacterium]|nr:VanW family protein [Acidimicrobiia bacterium]
MIRLRALLLIAMPVFILLMPVSIYMIDSAAASDRVARNVTIAGVDVARQTADEATAAVTAYTDALTAQPATVQVNGQTFTLDPAAVGLTFDTETAIDAAMEQRREGITDWIMAFTSAVEVSMSASIDADLLEEQLRVWEAEAIPNPAFEGSIAIVSGNVEVEYPRDGEAIDRDQAESLILESLRVGSDEVIVLPTAASFPTLTNADFDAAEAEADRIMATTVTLRQDEYDFEFTVEAQDVARSLSAEVTDEVPATIAFAFDHSVFEPLIEAAQPDLELAPVDATWATTLVDDFEDVDENYRIKDSKQDPSDLPADDTVRLVPHKNGTTIDVAEVAAAVELAARGDGTGELPIILDALPPFTTEMAEAYGELYEVSEFTTYMPGVNRAHNIRLMADLVDDTIVWPGDTFSVNDHVGRRTLEKGFKYDCAIVKGELSCEEEPVNVGGGVSQFGTTIFNAIYFGCYEDVTHTPHSIYFTKYPEGREATLGYPSPDVAFRNNSEAPVIIRTSYTNRSVTVTFFGNQNGVTCGTARSERSNVTDPVREYQADPDGVVLPGDEVTKSGGSKGWSVTNTRIFYDAQGNEIDREPFYWRYRGGKNVILLHPCDPRVGGNGVCPIQVPGVGGLDQASATATLEAAGFPVSVTFEETSDPAQGGVVLSSSPGGWQPPGTAITIVIGQYSGGDGGGGDGGGDGDGGGGDGDGGGDGGD